MLHLTGLFNHIAIKPTKTLADTADVLSEALGIKFEHDKEGRYEEFPAYIARTNGHELSLLGPPDPENDLRDYRTNEYELIVEQLDDTIPPDATFASNIMEQMNRSGRLNCELL